MNKARKWTTKAGIALAICGALLASACTTGGENNDDVKVDSVSLLTFGDADVTKGEGKGLTDIINAFTEETGMAGDMDRVPFDQFLATATTRARSGDLSDVVQMLPGSNYESLFSSLEQLKKSDFADADALTGWSSTIYSVEDNDTYVGVPMGAQGVVWYYNKELFQQAGLDPAKAPETWDELISACGKLNDAGIAPLGVSGSDSYIVWWIWSALSPQFFNSEDVIKVRAGEIPLTDERFAQSLKPIVETYQAGCWDPTYKGKKFTDVEADFAAGKVAMVPGLVSGAINWQVWDEKLGKDAYGVFVSPKAPDAKQHGQFFNPAVMYGISKDAPSKEAARKLIEAITSVDGQTAMLREASQFPNRTDVDVVGVTGSEGAGQILQIVDEVGGYDVAQNQFSGSAQAMSWAKLTEVIENNDIETFLADLDKEQQS